MWLRLTDPQVASIIFYYLGGLTVRDMRHLLDLLAPTEQVYHPSSQDNLKCRYPRAFQLRKRQPMLLSTEKYSISWPCSLLSLFPMDIMIKSPREDQVYCLGASTLLSKV